MKRVSFLDKCLDSLRESKGGEMLIDHSEKHHLLLLNGKKLGEQIQCTTRQADQLKVYADETELIPGYGVKYHFHQSFRLKPDDT